MTTRYESFNRFRNNYNSLPPYGTPWSRNCFLHFFDGRVEVSYRGECIFSAYPDGSNYLHIPENISNGLTYRWRLALSYDYALCSHIKRHRYRSGLISHTVELSIKQTPSTKETPLTTVTAYNRIQITAPGGAICIKAADLGTPVVDKDMIKYKAFGKKLKAIHVLLSTRLRMGVINPKDFYAPLETRTLSYKDELINLINIYDETKSEVLFHIAHICSKYHYSDAPLNTIEGALKRVKNGLKAAQTRYLQKHCVTISDSQSSPELQTNEYNDKDRQLLETSRLREVQTSSEAQVC